MAKHAHTTPVRRPEGAPSASGRRSLFGAAAALLVAPAATATPSFALNPDAALMAMCEQTADYSRRWTTLSTEACELTCGTPRERELSRALAALVDPIHALEDQVADTPATTLPGLRAKADALRLRLAAWEGDTEPMESEDNLAWSLALDVLRLIGGAA